jgi:DNA-binding CsgD family transcriptional regulator
MSGGGGDHKSSRATFEARAREAKIVQLRLRGASFEQIGQKLGINKSTATKAWHRVLRRLPAADLEELRKAQGERITLLLQKAWGEFSGRRDSSGDLVLPTVDQVNDLIASALKIERHEAIIFGLDAPTKSAVVSAIVTHTIGDDELDNQLGRLTTAEQEKYMELVAKMEGRLVGPEPVEQASIETTATTVKPKSQ